MAALQDCAQPDPGLSQPVDYDAEYRALDLLPGAALREIEDRARLLRTAFCPDDLPAVLQVPAAERAMQVSLAGDRLSRYWRTHGTPPPSGRIARLETARHAVAGPLSGASSQPRLHLVAQTESPPTRRDPSRGAGAAQSAALRAAIASHSALQHGGGRPEEPQQRRPLAIAWALLVKLVLAGLVVAAVVRVQQYRVDHPAVAAYADPNAVIATGLPGKPPVRWAGLSLPGRQVIGAAAPAITGRQRQH